MALRERGLEVTRTQFVLLGIQVLLAACAYRLVLEQFVTGVHPPQRAQRGRQHGADREHARAAVLQALVQDVGGVDEQVGPGLVGVRGDLLAELGELPLGGAPGEIAVGLGEAQLGQPVEPGRAGERLGQEQHVGVDALDPADQPRPEVRRLGVRIVDAEDLDAVIHPVPHHPQHLHVEAGRVVVEVERIDVLVLLRRVLRIGDGAVRQFGEPLPMVLGPRMVGSALQGQVERHLEAQIRSGGDEVVEVLDGAQLGVHGIVATQLAADRPG